MTYKEVRDEAGTLTGYMRSDGWFIPLDPNNTDYKALLAQMEAGYKPEPADH